VSNRDPPAGDFVPRKNQKANMRPRNTGWDRRIEVYDPLANRQYAEWENIAVNEDTKGKSPYEGGCIVYAPDNRRLLPDLSKSNRCGLGEFEDLVNHYMTE
jgi:hypothetical protein